MRESFEEHSPDKEPMAEMKWIKAGGEASDLVEKKLKSRGIEEKEISEINFPYQGPTSQVEEPFVKAVEILREEGREDLIEAFSRRYIRNIQYGMDSQAEREKEKQE